MKIVAFAAACLAVFSPFTPVTPVAATALGGDTGGPEYKVLAPISHGNLTIFPVVAARSHDTSAFLTLDEGIRSGEVTVTEVGKITPMVRRHIPRPVPGRAQVNQLVLVNNSTRPLILLAGEGVPRGQKGRIVPQKPNVPPGNDPRPLSLFSLGTPPRSPTPTPTSWPSPAGARRRSPKTASKKSGMKSAARIPPSRLMLSPLPESSANRKTPPAGCASCRTRPPTPKSEKTRKSGSRSTLWCSRYKNLLTVQSGRYAIQTPFGGSLPLN